ncbi:MAG: ASKHA domain-containing protein, partial [Woeseiaceae bacterium]
LVVFTPSGKRGRFPLGTRLLDAARDLGVDLDSVCGGRALCGRCQVTVAEGEFAKHNIVSRSKNLSARGEAEQNHRLRRGLADDRRLSCQASLQADVVIDVPASSQVHHQVVRKPHEAHDIEINPVVHLYYVEVAQPDMHIPSGDQQRLFDALEKDWQLENLSCEFGVTQSLQACLREGDWQVTVAVRNNHHVIAVWPGFKGSAFGVAVDVGSTTVAAHLCDLTSGEVLASAGKMNPQIRFGEDLMSRVSYIMMNPGGEDDLVRVVREAISELVAEVCEAAAIDVGDVVEMTVVGNPIMQHLVLGISPVELGTAPFALANDAAVDVLAADIGITINPGGHVYALPCIAGHVGADAAGVLLAEAPYARDEVSLIVDVGTNAEILVGNRERLLAASSPTGPAFEGAQISSGQRAAPGAIERVRIDRDTLEPKFKVIGCDLWSDDPQFADQVSASGVTGICGSGIIEAVAEMFLAGIIDEDGRISGDHCAASPRIVEDERTFAYVLHDGEPAIRILQNDIRAIQLAKAALYAGARLLMDRFGVDKVDRIRLAGAFGAHIDGRYAMTLGLIPDCDLDQVSSAGNAAGTGARIALLDGNARGEIESRVRQIEKIETATAAGFQDQFVAAMALPHKSDPFRKLSQTIELPAKSPTNSVTGRKRRVRR